MSLTAGSKDNNLARKNPDKKSLNIKKRFLYSGPLPHRKKQLFYLSGPQRVRYGCTDVTIARTHNSDPSGEKV
jgi:hypothetical protein